MKKKNLIISTVFWLVLGLLLFAFDAFIKLGVRNSTYAHYYKVNILAAHRVNPRIAIFGSSVGEVGINTKLLSDSLHSLAYNFSIDGTRLIQYSGLIKELNDYSDSCELVVFAEAFFSLDKTDQLTEVDRYMAHIDNDNIYESLHTIQPGLVWKLRHVPFYDFIAMKHSYIKASVTGLKSWAAGSDAGDPYLGYTARNQSWQVDMDSINRISGKIQIHIDSSIYYSYRDIIHRLRQKDRKVLIIIPPIYKEGLQLIVNMQAQKNAYQSLVQEGVYFLDYSYCTLSEDKKFFYNNSHLNNIGADIFTGMLLKDIQTILHPASNIAAKK